jgi:hypothetical protein
MEPTSEGRARITTVLVPTDFSDLSHKALRYARPRMVRKLVRTCTSCMAEIDFAVRIGFARKEPAR